MIAAAGAAVGAVEIEGLGGQPGQAGIVIQRLQLRALLGEAGGRREIDLDDPRIGSDRRELQARVRRWTVTLHDQRTTHRRSGLLHPGYQVDEVLHRIGGRQEDIERPVPDLGDQRSGRVGLGVFHDGVLRAHAGGQIVAGRQQVGLEGSPRRMPADRVQRQP